MPTMHNADMKPFEINTHTSLKENAKITHKPSSTCFVFVCQQGELEIKSMLLAASLKRYLRGKFECVAAIPQADSRWGIISEETRALMQTLGVRLVPITNPIHEDYPIGHKVACLDIDTFADRIVFLDSDILCLSEFWFESQSPFSAKPADLPTFTQNVAVWQQVYDLCHLPLPDQRIISSVSGELMLPYFNSGVIAVQNGLGFAKVWAECCQTIDIETSITNKRPWLDQIALPIAVAKLNLAYDCLDERFNYPAHLKPLPKSPNSQKPFLCHYHSPEVLRREPQLHQFVTELVATYPILKKKLLEWPEWAQLLKPAKLPRLSKPFQPEPEAIITGIPRSGTSYLCRLLHTLPDCVVINEPPQIIAPLAHESRPWRIATFYQALRRDILEGKLIENKLQNGEVIEDTAIIDTRTHYQPIVSRADFLLCTKNTLAYLSRLHQLKQVMPHAPIIACVRHPLDTIASWKSTFPHLKHATVTDFPVGQVNDPFLSPWQRDRLAEIAASPKEHLKRALLWRYLAECILTDAAQLTVVRYEDLVLEPVKVLQTILDHIPNAPHLQGIEKITPSTVRQKRELLETDDIQAIRDICSQYAAELGYTFSDQPKNQENPKNPKNHVGWVERSESQTSEAKPTVLSNNCPKKAIIILGMHRSGTSALTGVLNLLGVDLGTKLLPKHVTNERGFWENVQIVEINEKILNSLNSSWDDITPLPPKWWQSETLAPFKKAINEIHNQNFATSPLWGIKDPRLCRLLPLWLPILEASGSVLHFVIVTRNPHEVAASLAKRDGLSGNTSFQLWLENSLAAEKQTQSYSRVFVTYDELLQDWQSTVEKIARVLKLEYAHSIQSVQHKITAFLSTDLKHHHQLTTPDLDQHLAAYGERVYQTFIAAAQGDSGSLNTLNQIRQALVKYNSRSPIQAPKTLACQHVYDILIPIYNAYDEVNLCIESVIRHTDAKQRLFLMDDASTDSRILPLLTRFAQNYLQITVLPAENHLGLVANINRQLNGSENDVVILASDTQVTKHWLEKMERCLKSDPAIGIVSPLSNHATLLSVPVMNEHNVLSMQLIDFAHLIENCSVRRYPRIPTAGGSCLLITRQTLNQLGDFDEAFAPGYGVECDYSMRAWRENIEIACCDDAYIYHVGGASLESVPNSEIKRHQNKELLDKRWPRFHEALSVFCQVNPLRDIQERIYTASQNDYRPRILHVLSDFETSDHFFL